MSSRLVQDYDEYRSALAGAVRKENTAIRNGLLDRGWMVRQTKVESWQLLQGLR